MRSEDLNRRRRLVNLAVALLAICAVAVQAAQPVDFRKGMDALAGLVAKRLSENPYAGTIFVFRSKRADRVKILAFDGTGLILATKRLEEGRFTWPPIQGGVVRLTAAQFSMLIDGLDWTRVSPRPVRRPLRVE